LHDSFVIRNFLQGPFSAQFIKNFVFPQSYLHY